MNQLLRQNQDQTTDLVSTSKEPFEITINLAQLHWSEEELIRPDCLTQVPQSLYRYRFWNFLLKGLFRIT